MKQVLTLHPFNLQVSQFELSKYVKRVSLLILIGT